MAPAYLGKSKTVDVDHISHLHDLFMHFYSFLFDLLVEAEI